MARPPLVRMRATGASVRISAPNAARRAGDRRATRRRSRPWGCPRPETRRRSRPCSDGAGRRPCPASWMPRYVPMMPDALIVALSGSVSNHWSRKSAALIVMSCTKTACWRSGSGWNARPGQPAAGTVAGRARSGRPARCPGWIGTAKSLHPDFGPPPYGIPYVVVAGDQARVPVTFQYDLGERHRHSGAGGLSDT